MLICPKHSVDFSEIVYSTIHIYACISFVWVSFHTLNIKKIKLETQSGFLACTFSDCIVSWLNHQYIISDI